ncbi:right-handed parallel beta-helix repeat-containing protein [Leptobacterium sp. I13]|uniref:right-handed parallel beta-helix repeat-containing protein n=1 Tax=Leptobacterium meishanense TaxID=3128904 RepID=UPI0030EC96D8
MKILVTVILLLGGICSIAAQKVKASVYGYNPQDATAAFQQAVQSEADTIIIDKQFSDWHIRPTVFRNLSNKTILFEKGVTLRAKKGAFTNESDRLLEFINAENVKIIGNGALFIMDKDEYITGEWRHSISLRKCRNIYIEKLTIANSGGDGIYIAGLEKGSYSENITINAVTAMNNKRQGISIISGKNIYISQSVFKNTKGTLPGAGVDIEPNHNQDKIINIRFENCSFIDNDHAGILLALNKMDHTSEPVSVYFSNCYLKNNHNPENRYAASEIIVGASPLNPVKGEVIFNNCLIDGSKWGMLYSRKTRDAYHVTFKDCAAINISQDNTWPPIYLEVPDYNKETGALGGFTFQNVMLAYKTALPFFQVRGSKKETLKEVAGIYGDITVINPWQGGIKYLNYNPENNRQVRITYTIITDKDY